jgi:hypothetical protein
MTSNGGTIISNNSSGISQLLAIDNTQIPSLGGGSSSTSIVDVTGSNINLSYNIVFTHGGGTGKTLFVGSITTLSTINPNTGEIQIVDTLKITNNTVSVGKNSGVSQLADSISIGSSAGLNQSLRGISIGLLAGSSQGNDSIAIGSNSGLSQGEESVAIGSYTGTNQGVNSVAIGAKAGQTNQDMSACAFGSMAGNLNQRNHACAFGASSGKILQGIYSVCVGYEAGENIAGDSSLLLGALAGKSSSADNSIILNATGTDLSSATTGLFVKPIRTLANVSTFQSLYYNTSTGEVSSKVYVNPANLITSGNLDVSGISTLRVTNVTDITASGTLYVSGISTLGVTNVYDITASGISTFGVTNVSDITASGISTLGVTNVTDITASGTLGVTGISTLGLTNVTDISASGTLDVSGISTLGVTNVIDITASGNLDVSGISTLGVTNATDITAGGTLGVNGISTLGLTNVTNISASGTLDVTGISTLGLTNITNITASGTLGVTGISTLGLTNVTDITASGSLDVSGISTLEVTNVSDITASGTLDVSGISTQGVTNVSALTASGTCNIAGILTSQSQVYLQGNTDIGGQINVFGPSILHGTLDVSGISTLRQTNISDITVSGALDVSGISTLGVTDCNTLTALTNITGFDTLNITGVSTLGVTNVSALTTSGTCNIAGTFTSQGNATLSGTLGVVGNTTLGAALGVTGNTTLASLTATNIDVTNSLKIESDKVFIGKNSGGTQAVNSTIINSSGNTLNSANTGLFIDPIRNNVDPSGLNALYFDTSTKEIYEGIIIKSKWYENNTIVETVELSNSSIPNEILNVPITAGTYRATFNTQIKALNGLSDVLNCPSAIESLITELSSLTYVPHISAFGLNEVITAGYYFQTGATTHSGTIFLDAQGDVNALFVFKCGAAHAINVANSSISLINGARACNVFWLINGAITTASNCILSGTYIGMAAISLSSGCNISGRICSTNGAIVTTNITINLPTNFNYKFKLGAFSSFAIFNIQGDITNALPSNITSGNIACGNGSVIGFQSPIINQTHVKATANMLNPVVSFSLGIYINNILVQSSYRFSMINTPNNSIIETGCNITTTTSQTISAKILVTSFFGAIIVGNRTIFALQLL